MEESEKQTRLAGATTCLAKIRRKKVIMTADEKIAVDDSKTFTMQLNPLQARLDVHYVVRKTRYTSKTKNTSETKEPNVTTIKRDTPESEYIYLVTNLAIFDFHRICKSKPKPVSQMYLAILCIFKWALDTIYPQMKVELEAFDRSHR